MKASAIEYRLRGLILTIIVVLGFWAPWIQAFDLGKRVSLLEWLALEMSRAGLLRFTYATPVVIVAGALLAALGMVLRITGAAYLGPGTVLARSMSAGTVQSAGPYRYVRNPLYLGAWFVIAAIAFLMPPTGALFAVPVTAVFLLRLILAEETLLSAQLGAAYREYQRATPRIVPRLRTMSPLGLTRASDHPRWPVAVLSELNSVSVFVVLAILSWSYDHELMIKGIVVGFGISLVARALVAEKQPAGITAA